MLIFTRSTPITFIKKKEVWFGGKPKLRNIFNTFYFMAGCSNFRMGFTRVSYTVKRIRLSDFSDDISLLSSFSKNNIYKIKRAEREGIQFHIEKSFSSLIKFYDAFAISKNYLSKIDPNIFEYSSNFLMTKAIFENEVLVMHSYLYDDTSGIAFLYTSSSLFREEDDSKKRSLIGRANRYLHFEDMKYFKKMRYKIYDWGGYGSEEENATRGIDAFKDSFGKGHTELITHYYPLWHSIIGRLKK